MTRVTLVALAVVFLYGSPAHALTKPTRVAPPGNAGATQYQENVPSAGGGVPVVNLPPAAGAPAAGATGQVLPPSIVRRLDHAGASGRAVVALANRTAPATVKVAPRRAGGSRSSGTPSTGTPSDARRLPASASVGSQLSNSVIEGSGGGLGLLLPAALIGSLMLASGVVIARHRQQR